MTTIIHGSRNRVRLIHEIAFSVYFPLLLILVNSIRSAQHPARPSWINEFQLLIAGNKGAYSYYCLAFVILWVSSAAVLFFFLRLAARLSLSDVFLRLTCRRSWFPGCCGIRYRSRLHAYVRFVPPSHSVRLCTPPLAGYRSGHRTGMHFPLRIPEMASPLGFVTPGIALFDLDCTCFSRQGKIAPRLSFVRFSR
jgi:hypothetical protein